MESKILKIEGMTCAACARTVERTSGKLPGVKSASVNFATEKLNINYDNAVVTLSDIQKAVEKAGYRIRTETNNKIFKLEGMTCAACAKTIEKAVRKLPGVIEANVNFAAEKLIITFDPSLVKTSDIKRSVEKAGYKASEEESNIDVDKERKEKEIPDISNFWGAIIADCDGTNDYGKIQYYAA
jgi:Cu+-exporting ATPase